MSRLNKALELLAKMEEDDNKPIVSEEKDVPENIEVPEVAAAVAPIQFSEGGKETSDDDDEEEEEETRGNPTLKAACNPALDSDDDSSSHSSQPSDDSTLIKKARKTPV